MFFCEFPEISTNNFFIENIRATAFVLSFVNPRKKSEATSLIKFLQSRDFNMKWKEKKRPEATTGGVLLRMVSLYVSWNPNSCKRVSFF